MASGACFACATSVPARDAFRAPPLARGGPGRPRRHLARRSRPGRACAAAAVPSPSPSPSAAASAGLVLAPSADPAAWDSGAVAGAVVRLLGDGGDDHARGGAGRDQDQDQDQAQGQARGGAAAPTWAMWYGGRPRDWPRADRAPPGLRAGFAGLALSTDGVVWTRVQGPMPGGAILEPNDQDWWWFDVAHLAIGDVDVAKNRLVRSDAGVYFAYYAGGDSQLLEVNGGKVSGLRTSIGLALSKDGEHWTRIEGEHPSGAVLEPGPEGAFDALGVAGPSVTRFPGARNSPEYLMHYYAYDAARGTFAIGRALSGDGFKFVRDNGGEPVLEGSGPGSGALDERGVSNSCVVRRRNASANVLYVMFVEVIDGRGIHRIAMAESSNALEWSPPEVVLDIPDDPNAWDAGGLSHPSAVVVGDEVWLYYTGQGADLDGEGNFSGGIGVAKSNGSDWSALHRVSP